MQNANQQLNTYTKHGAKKTNMQVNNVVLNIKSN